MCCCSLTAYPLPVFDDGQVFQERQKMILAQATSRFSFNVTFFKTSIWDETLYQVGRPHTP